MTAPAPKQTSAEVRPLVRLPQSLLHQGSETKPVRDLPDHPETARLIEGLSPWVGGDPQAACTGDGGAPLRFLEESSSDALAPLAGLDEQVLHLGFQVWLGHQRREPDDPAVDLGHERRLQA